MNEQEFQEMIAAFVQAQPGHKKFLTKTFSVSLPTVERWVAGESHPHPNMRGDVARTAQAHLCTKQCESV